MMNKVLNGFVNRVFWIRVEGSIDQKLSDSISRGLQNAWPYAPTALLVSINSPGGSIVQAKSISDLLNVYSHRYNVPIVTFAQDQCLGSANLLLTSGVKCYSNGYSLLGDAGFSWSKLWYNKFSDKYNIKQEYIFAGENKVKFNQFQEMKPESEEWMKAYLRQMEKDLLEGIISNRKEHFLRKNISSENFQKMISESGIIDPEQAVKTGYIDGIRNLDQEIKQRYWNVPVKQINTIKESMLKRLAL